MVEVVSLLSKWRSYDLVASVITDTKQQLQQCSTYSSQSVKIPKEITFCQAYPMVVELFNHTDIIYLFDLY